MYRQSRASRRARRQFPARSPFVFVEAHSIRYPRRHRKNGRRRSAPVPEVRDTGGAPGAVSWSPSGDRRVLLAAPRRNLLREGAGHRRTDRCLPALS
eukprot:scaffold22350_cov124-Isochrysis_galbana.AAC.5